MNRLELAKTESADSPKEAEAELGATAVAPVVRPLPHDAEIDRAVASAPTMISSGSVEDEQLPDRIGLVLGGKYRLDTLLGAGGMGQVYRATHLALGEPVAVKFLLSQWAMMPEIRTRFRREASALAKLRHPGIVSVLDFGEHEGSLFMVMELIAGVTLDRMFGLLNVQQIGTILDQILQVLEAAHAAGIVHRDMKPENVMMLDSNDRVDRIKVLDFGIALVQEGDGVPRLTDVGTVRGTPLYMSPEQCRGREVGPPTDIYAVGVMIYELFAGRTPFLGETAADLSAQHMYVDPPHLDTTTGVVPVGLDAVIRRALAKRADERPTAAEFRDELAQVFRGTDATAIAVRAVAERVRMAHLSREDRAITRKPAQAPASVAPPSAQQIAIATSSDARWLELRDSLSVQGFGVVRWQTSATREPATSLPKLIVIAESSDATLTLETLRREVGPKLPVMVIDVESPEQTTKLIRAGASDVVLRSAPLTELAPKLARLIRRGR
ncbi:MAG: serine/threonine-protein kinase [Polyangiaceae bacterium]